MFDAAAGRIATDRLCGPPCGSRPSDCARGLAGTWSGVSSLAACRSACLRCDQCRFVSYSARQQECLWNRHCAPQTVFGRAHEGFDTFGVRPGAHSYNISANTPLDAPARCQL